jgi:hypothetical protein
MTGKYKISYTKFKTNIGAYPRKGNINIRKELQISNAAEI